MSGRPPKLQNQKTGHYTKEQIKSQEENLPIYQSQEFTPPATLTDKELDVWNWLVKIFRGTVNCMVSDADVQLMELYCRAKVATDEADAELKKDNRAYVLVDSGMTDKERARPWATFLTEGAPKGASFLYFTSGIARWW